MSVIVIMGGSMHIIYAGKICTCNILVHVVTELLECKTDSMVGG